MSAPRHRSHFLPRTRAGRTATWSFLALYALCMPPFTHTVWNRITPSPWGIPFLWVVLLVVYVLLIVVLVRAYRAGV